MKWINTSVKELKEATTKSRCNTIAHCLSQVLPHLDRFERTKVKRLVTLAREKGEKLQ